MKEERIDIILLVRSGTTRHVARTFNETHRTLITHDTVAKLIQKFRRTGSVDDETRSGRPKTATDEGTSMMVLAAMVKSPKKGNPTPLCRNRHQPKQCHVHLAY